jgi:hypothetical protein
MTPYAGVLLVYLLLKRGCAASAAPREGTGDAPMATMLTTAQQVELLKQDGVKFELCSEEDAVCFMQTQANYFKLQPYTRLFERCRYGPNAGKFYSLDFEQLRCAVRLDQELMTLLFQITHAIERCHKVEITEQLAAHGEDDCGITQEYFASLNATYRTQRERELANALGSSLGACYPAVDRGHPAIDAFLEFASFGTLIDFTRFCALRWNDKALKSRHYDLKGAKALRNCVAHDLCIIPLFALPNRSKLTVGTHIYASITKAGVTPMARDKWVKRAGMREIAITLVVYSQITSCDKAGFAAQTSFETLFNKLDSLSSLFPANGPNATLWAALNFMKELTYGLNLIV